MITRGWCIPLVAVLLSMSGCGDAGHKEPAGEQAPKPVPAAPAPATPTTPPSAAKPQEVAPERPSVYELSAKLEDQSGKALTLDAFRGQPVVLSMFYSGCKSMCPLLITHLHAINAALPADVRAKTRILMVSFDPEHDTPQKMKALADAHAIDTTHWTLTRTSASSVQELAAVLDIRYRKLPNGDFVHSSIITVLDRAGRPILRGDDSELQPEQVAKAVAQVLTTP